MRARLSSGTVTLGGAPERVRVVGVAQKRCASRSFGADVRSGGRVMRARLSDGAVDVGGASELARAGFALAGNANGSVPVDGSTLISGTAGAR
ncbi:hypothetical protein EBN03_12225 [Nocardia stercoris]|uniref:Uncharacterized protein n=1 Tax=Nocardia stercoris TaxID=2483361 RepID=A0A3M2L4Y0_9NOCA|nr:hypothetical protein EBN03_12225 [Nocardia stercoris]